MSNSYDTLSECLISEFDVAPELVRPEATLANLELDSLALVELSLMMEERLGVTVPDIRRDATLAELATTADACRSTPQPAVVDLDGGK
ncbi:acyl carrier protein [Kitasatospora sp. NPDC085879]|uniref:acyl carrier protein n=1 Tax=Kitasatospora sp. NPDC085879 TaxID=3154769 RepID=UPI003428FFA0